jgi:hypothetical protein
MPRSLAVLILAAVAAVLLAVPATAGEAAIIRPPELYASKLAGVRAKSGVDVYLPSRMRVFVRASRVKGTVDLAQDGSYDLELQIGGSRCRGANACFLGNFTGTRGEEPAFARKARLTGGRTGYWKGITCGASCSPAEIQWVENGVLYSIATKSVTKSEKTTLVKLANSAITAGPR